MRRFFLMYVLEFACAALLGTAANAAPVTVHKVSALPALNPLTMSVGGRVLITPAVKASQFGGSDFTSQWPGSYFRAAFKGTTVFFRVVRGDEILHVVVDGGEAAPLVKPEAGVYEVDGLSDGEHRIDVLVATESQAGANTFGGFAIAAGEKALRPARRRRQMEFIGDSYTVGYGDLSDSRKCTKAQVWSDTDDTKAFGPMTAEHYDADYEINAISGRGVVRNYDGIKADTLPEAYPYVLFDKKQAYKDRAWKPQVLVVGLGTNDFSTPLNAGERWKTRDELHVDYEAAYVKFLKRLRAENPNAFLIVWAADVFQGEVEAEAQKVVAQLKKQGEERITFLAINGLSFSACDSHPSVADQRAISDKLEKRIDAEKQVWRER